MHGDESALNRPSKKKELNNLTSRDSNVIGLEGYSDVELNETCFINSLHVVHMCRAFSMHTHNRISNAG
jgi:hypothetical protein